MKILYLYEEVMGYTIATIRALVERGAEVHILHWDHKKLTPYQFPKLPNVYMYERSNSTVDLMKALATKIAPDITVISGWNDKGYLRVARMLRTKDMRVVTGLDSQWHGHVKQRVAALLGSIGYFSRYFSHAWVSGSCQFEYARRLGFKKNRIVYDLYSADLNIYHRAYNDYHAQKRTKYPHRFLFVGRFEPVKGLDTLLHAWELLGEKKLNWELHLIGKGSLKSILESTSGIVVKDFMQPDKLMQEVAHSGCFILPSRNEPWGVVVHEFAAAGMPLLISDVVGAANTFLISGMNGFKFKVNDAENLAKQMARIINIGDQTLLAMSDNSYHLSQRITPESSAANLLSCAI